jgi:hypothetical protein
MNQQAVGKIPVKPIVVDVNGLNIAFDMSLLKIICIIKWFQQDKRLLFRLK